MRSQRVRRSLVLGTAPALLLAVQAAAHPGHGAGGGSFGLAHHLTEPLHAVTTLLCVVAVAGALVWARRTRRRV